MKAFKFPLVILLFSLFIFSACSEDDDDPVEVEPQYLVEADVVMTINSASLSLVLQQLGDAVNLADMIKYDVAIYKLVYKTYFEGDTIDVSGVFACPVSSGSSFPIISYQHGTIFTKAQAPSEYINSLGSMMLGGGDNSSALANETLAGVFMASTGNIVLMPDYIGFGESAEFFHPYMHVEYTNNAVLDMIRASKEFIQTEEPCSSNNKLFLLGYSQGGSATAGSLYAIENVAANCDIEVTAAVAGSGAYNLSKFREHVMRLTGPYEKPSFILYIFESLLKYGNVDVDYSLVFSEEYAASVQGMIDGTTTSAAIDDVLGQYMGRIFNDDFEDDDIFDSSDAYASLRAAFEANSLTGWEITTPLKLYYGNSDIWVPSTQSSLFYSSFPTSKQGSVVEVNSLGQLDHTGAFLPTMVDALDWFSEF